MTQQSNQVATMPQAGMPMQAQPQGSYVAIYQNWWNANQENIVKRFFEGDKVKSLKFFNEVMEQVNDNPALRTCPPEETVKECLKLVPFGLSCSKAMAHAYIIPYNNHPQVQISYRGLLLMAIRSGFYKIINTGKVYEGQLVSQNMLTGDIILDASKKVSEKVVGYFAYFETENPRTRVEMRHTEYMTVDEMVAHAKAYVKTLKNVTEDMLQMKAQDTKPTGIGWVGNFESMALKTVLKRLLKWGNMSSEIAEAIENDNEDVSIEDRKTTVMANTGTQSADDIAFEDVSEPQAQAPTF